MERYDANKKYRVNIATVDEGGEGDSDTVPQLLLVAKSNLGISVIHVQNVIHVKIKMISTSLLLLILARSAAPSGRTYFAPIPGKNLLFVVSFGLG